MNSLKDEIESSFAESFEDLKRLRDEVKLKIHLGGMEARDVWNEVEPKIEKIEDEIRESYEKGSEQLKNSVAELKERVSELAQQLPPV